MSEPWAAGHATSDDDGSPSGAGAAGSPLRGVDYPPAAECLWRWVDAPADAAVSTFLAGYVPRASAERAALRAGLCPDDLYTLLTFARRRAFAAIRTGIPTEVRSAFDALSAIELDRIDWRDVWVGAALAAYAAQRLGLPPTETVRGAARRAEPELAALLTEVTADRVDLAQECGYRVLETPGGRVLVDDEGREYAPEADLTGLAFDAAEMLERDSYQVRHVSVATDLPDVWLGGVGRSGVRSARDGLAGCVHLHAEPGDADAEQQLLLVFLAEAASVGDAVRLADAATRYPAYGAVELGISAGRYCAVVVARSTVLGMPVAESPASLARFGPRLAAILPTGSPSAG